MTEYESERVGDLLSKAHFRGYLIGLFMACSLSGGFRDFVGRDVYIRMVREHWSEIPWEFWMIVFLGSIWMLGRGPRRNV